MAARITKTPGATTPAPKTTEIEVVTTTTADQADAALNAILGTPEDQNEKDPEPTSTVSEPVTTPTPEEVAAKKEYEEFLEWRNSKGKKASAAPVAQHVGTSDATTPKRTRQVCGPHGWTTEEY